MLHRCSCINHVEYIGSSKPCIMLRMLGWISMHSRAWRHSLSDSDGWEVRRFGFGFSIVIALRLSLHGLAAVERNIMMVRVSIAVHFGLTAHHLNSLYVWQLAEVRQAWSTFLLVGVEHDESLMTRTMTSNLWSGSGFQGTNRWDTTWNPCDAVGGTKCYTAWFAAKGVDIRFWFAVSQSMSICNSHS